MRLLAALGCGDIHLSDANDPDDMDELIKSLEYQDFFDSWGGPVRPYVLAAALRKHSFDVERAADELERVTARDSYHTSVPAQWALCEHVGRWEPCFGPDNDPPEMGEFMEALQELPLFDRRGRPFCDEVIAAAIRGTWYDPLAAADILIVAADNIHRRELDSNLEIKRAAYRKLTDRFKGVYTYSIEPTPEPWHGT
jgi:hypothetical protein